MKTKENILAKWRHPIKEESGHDIEKICMLEAMEEYAKAYHEDKTRWISVGERLPEVDNSKNKPFGERIDCLVVYDGYVYKGQYMNIGEPFWSVSHICSSSSLGVTHWQPLPTSPTINQPDKV